jgi:hypothetical protein
MNAFIGQPRAMTGPKRARRRDRRHSYDESLDEPAKLLQEEPTDIEEAAPALDNEPVEQSKDDRPDSPAFEEEG